MINVDITTLITQKIIIIVICILLYDLVKHYDFNIRKKGTCLLKYMFNNDDR